MTFQVTRTSDWTCEQQPCDSATKMELDVDGRKYHIWTVDIQNLESLILFIETHHNVIVTHGATRDNFPQLEIYDDYRE